MNLEASRSPHRLLLAAFTLACGTLSTPAQDPPEVREFRSKSGSKLKAMILEVQPSGQVILQRYAPQPVPLNSLSEEDQAYINAWKERHEKEQEWIRQGSLAEQYKDPGVSLLKDTLRTLDDGQWKPYEPKNIENLELVAYYFSKEHPDDGFIHSLSDSYEKMTKRSDVVEVVYVTLGTSDQAVRDYVKDKEFAFPIFDPASIGLINNSVVGSLFKGAYPQLVVIDRKGVIKVDSFRGKDETPQLGDTLDQLEDLVREADRQRRHPPKAPE